MKEKVYIKTIFEQTLKSPFIFDVTGGGIGLMAL